MTDKISQPSIELITKRTYIYQEIEMLDIYLIYQG